jgi:hypothetical protein
MAVKQIDLKEVQRISEVLQKIDAQSLASNPQECHVTAIWCASQRAYTGEQMAIAKNDWQRKKVNAYHTFIASSKANGFEYKTLGVMAIKDYIASRCGDAEATYEFIERTNNALGSMEDVLRSVISALKQEMYSAQTTN